MPVCVTTSRTNAFKVKDIPAFLAWADLCGLNAIEQKGRDGQTRFWLLPIDEIEGSFPSWRDDEATGEELEIHLATELPAYLAEGEIAILISASAEAGRSASGWAEAVAWDGRHVRLVLSDIYRKAIDELGANPFTLTTADGCGDSPYQRLRGITAETAT